MAMSFFSMWEAKLPPGFRFHPRDEELITDYLAKKITGEPNSSCPMMEVVDLNKVEPWELPETARVGEKEWYFFTTRDKKYATGHRTNRATSSGYWKATGKDRRVTDGRRGGREVGMRKTLVFYQGRAPKGKKTDWVMHEFRADQVDLSGDHRLFPPPTSSSSKDDWVLCRVFYKRRDLSPKPTNSMEENNFYNSEASCSLPPLLDTHINFDQHNQPLSNNIDNNLQGYNIEQVPCFSNLRFHPPPALPTPTMDSKISLSSSSPSSPSSLPQLGTAHLPDMSSFLTNIFDGH